MLSYWRLCCITNNIGCFRIESYWSLGAILLGVFFFVAGQVLTYVLVTKYVVASHYVDGLFFEVHVMFSLL